MKNKDKFYNEYDELAELEEERLREELANIKLCRIEDDDCESCQ